MNENEKKTPTEEGTIANENEVEIPAEPEAVQLVVQQEENETTPHIELGETYEIKTLVLKLQQDAQAREAELEKHAQAREAELEKRFHDAIAERDETIRALMDGRAEDKTEDEARDDELTRISELLDELRGERVKW